MRITHNVRALTLILIISVLHFAVAQDSSLSDRHKRWLNDEVRYIISDEERSYFKKLGTAAAREEFITAFWQAHDPTPLTSENEFRREHYRRLSEAERLFGSDPAVPGRLSRKQVHILLGNPEEIITFQGSDLVSRMEAWRYTPFPVLGINEPFYLLWFEERGATQPRIFHSGMESPGHLLRHALGKSDEESLRELFRIDPLLGYLALSHTPADHNPIIFNNTTELRRALHNRGRYSEKLLAAIRSGSNAHHQERFELMQEIMRGEWSATEPSYRQARIEVDTHTFQLTNPQGERQVFISYQLDARDVKLKDYFGRCYSVLIFRVRVVDTYRGSEVLRKEERVSASFKSSDISAGRSAHLIHLSAMDLEPGIYRIETAIRNPLSGTEVNLEDRVRVSTIEEDAIALGQPLFLLQGLRRDGNSSAEEVTGLEFYPSPDMVLERGENAVLFFQISCGNPAKGASIALRYTVRHNRRVLWQYQENIAIGSLSAGGTYTHKIAFPTSRFPPGSYSLQVEARDAEGRSDTVEETFMMDHRLHNAGVAVLANQSQ